MVRGLKTLRVNVARSGRNASFIDANGTEVSCGFAPVLEVIFDDSTTRSAPAWYTDPLIIDPNMRSPIECQAWCYDLDGCDFFSYRAVLVHGVVSHECYLKRAYTEPQCIANQYVPWKTSHRYHG